MRAIIGAIIRLRVVILIGIVAVLSVYIVLYTPVLFSDVNQVKVKLQAQNLTLKEIAAAKKEEPSSSSEEKPAPAEVEKTEGEVKEELDKIEEKEERPIALRNPFDVDFSYERPKETNTETEKSKATPKTLTLQGIFLIEGKKVAIINDQVVYPGDKVLGWRVYQIYSSKVVLTRDSRSLTLKLEIGGVE